MNNYNVQTLRYKNGDLYPEEHITYADIKIEKLIVELKKTLKRQRYFNIYSYYDGGNWYIESSNKKGNEKIFKIEEEEE